MANECTVIYYAFDRKDFKTEKECLAYNALPRIYIVEWGIFGSIETVFVSEEDAKDFCKEGALDYTIKAIPIFLPKHREKTIQTQVTNTDTKNHWWSNLWK